MVIPAVPQIHEGLLGAHVVSTDLDKGSAHAALVCGPNDKVPMFVNVHPAIKFDEPMASVGVRVVGGPTNKVIWDAQYNLGGLKELKADAVAGGGSVPNWTQICTNPGAIEQYKMIIKGTGMSSGPFESISTFTSNNAQAVQIPYFVFPKRPVYPGVPKPAVAVPFNAAHDLNPMSYL